MSPAEERAALEGLPIVRMVPHDVMSVLQGRALIVGLADGSEALVRLYTAEEFLEVQHAAAEKYGAEKITLARAAELVRAPL